MTLRWPFSRLWPLLNCGAQGLHRPFPPMCDSSVLQSPGRFSPRDGQGSGMCALCGVCRKCRPSATSRHAEQGYQAGACSELFRFACMAFSNDRLLW